MSEENVEKLRAVLEGWNPRDMDMSLLDPEVIYEDTVLPDHAGERYRGHEGVARATRRWIEPYEELSLELEQLIGAEDRFVSAHRARAKARHSGIEGEIPVFYAWTFRNGKVIHFRSFIDREAALEAVGLSE